jgi:hypothetical protein
MGKVIKNYISEIDKHLAAYNQIHPKTASQQTEIDKYARIHRMRDTPVNQPDPEEDIWDF